jgi:hypothetical protein
MSTEPTKPHADRLRRVFASPGVRRFGLPWGVSMALLTHGRDYGLAPASLLTERFAVALVSYLFAGVLAGILFARAMRALGAPVEDAGRPDGDPPA